MIRVYLIRVPIYITEREKARMAVGFLRDVKSTWAYVSAESPDFIEITMVCEKHIEDYNRAYITRKLPKATFQRVKEDEAI